MYGGPERRGTLNGIERETFEGMDTRTQNLVLYDYHVSIHNMLYRLTDRIDKQCPKQFKECDARFDKIDARKWWHVAASTVGGFFGGATAILAKTFFIEK